MTLCKFLQTLQLIKGVTAHIIRHLYISHHQKSGVYRHHITEPLYLFGPPSAAFPPGTADLLSSSISLRSLVKVLLSPSVDQTASFPPSKFVHLHLSCHRRA